MSSASRLFSSRSGSGAARASPSSAPSSYSLPSPPPPPSHAHVGGPRLPHLSDADPDLAFRRRRRNAGDHRDCILFPRSENEFNASTSARITEASTNDVDRPRTANGGIYDPLQRSDRLPHAVLQARARLVNRLQGASLVRRSVLSSFACIPRCHGLSSVAINCLKREIFTHKEPKDEFVHVSLDCSICLETFIEGAILIQLPCCHGFHPSCLVPWLRNHGDCPNCRAPVKQVGSAIE